MNYLLVGSTECSIPRLVTIILSSSTGGVVAEKWTRLAQQLGVEDAIVSDLCKDYLAEKRHTSDTIREILSNWRIQNGNTATLANLICHLQALGWINVIDQLKEEFCMEESDTENLTAFKTTFPDRLPYYINRMLSPRYTLSKKIFKESNGNDVIVVAGLRRRQFNELTKGNISDSSRNQIHSNQVTASFIILVDMDDWLRLRQKSRRPIHLIFGNYEKDEYTWIDSKGNVSHLQKFIAATDEALTELSFITELDAKSKYLKLNQPVCIADTPGMGKSIFLMEVGRHLQNFGDDRIVIFVVLNEWITEVKKPIEIGVDINLAILNSTLKMACDNNMSVEQLTSHLTCEDKLETKLELLFDGFDEVNSDQFQFSCVCLKHFLRFKKHIRIWVSTRPHLRTELENTLSVLAYNIVPFDTPHQIQFLESFWSFRHYKYQLSQERVSKFTRKCLEAIKCELKSKDEDIAGVPLQCMLIAESYEEEVLEYSETGSEFCLHIQIKSIMDLYESLITKKFAKYVSQLASSEIEAYSDNETKLAHAYLALQLIFPHVPWVLKCCCKHEELVPLMHIFRIGIVEEATSGEARFIHRTFAEYFIAWFVIESLKTSWDNKLTMFLLNHILENIHVEELCSNDFSISSRQFQYPVVCYFMDCMLQQNWNHNQEVVKIYFKPCMEAVILIRYLISACLHSDSMHLFKFLHEVVPLGTYPEKYFSTKHFFTAVWKSSLDLILNFVTIYKNVLPTDLTLHAPGHKTMKDLNVAVMRGNYSVFQYIMSRYPRSSSQSLWSNPNFLLELLRDCMNKSQGFIHGKHEIQQRSEILKTLLATIPPDMKKLQFDKGSFDPIVPMLTQLVRSGKFSFTTKWMESILLSMSISNISSYQYHELLQSFPLNKVISLVNESGGSFFCLLAQLSNLNLDSLRLFQNCSFNFNQVVAPDGHSFLQECAKRRGRILTEDSIKITEHNMLEYAIDLGADYNVINEHGSVLHTAASHCNLRAMVHLLTKVGMDANIMDNDGRTPLDYAVRDYNGSSDHYAVAMYLINHGGYITISTEKLSKMLFKSAKRCCPVTIRILTELFQVDINMLGENGMTPLHHAFTTDKTACEDPARFETVEYLLVKGANVNAKNGDGESSLEFALLHGPENLSVTVYNLLISSGAIPFNDPLVLLFWIATWNVNGETLNTDQDKNSSKTVQIENFDPFPTSPLKESDQIRCIKHLLSTGNFNVNTKGLNEDTLLHVALSGSKGCKSELVEMLLEAGADINEVNWAGQTPLFRGWCSEDEEIVNLFERRIGFLKYCLRKGRFQLEKADLEGYTLIHFIISQMENCTAAEFHKLVETLVEADQINIFQIPNFDEKTPLMTAVQIVGDLSENTLQLLYKKGVDFNAIDARGYSVLHYMLEGEYFDDVHNLINLGARCHCQSSPSDLEIEENEATKFSCVLHLEGSMCLEPGSALPLFLEKTKGCDINAKNSEGKTPLHLLCGDIEDGKFVDAVHDYVEHGADLNIPDGSGKTVLHHAIMSNLPVSTLMELVRIGANWRAVDNHNFTMLHMSASCGHHQALSYFLELGQLDLNGVDGDGDTPLHCVLTDAERNVFKIVKLLMEHGADIDVVNKNDETPVDLAIRLMHDENILNMLM